MPKISVLAQKMRPCPPPPSTVMVSWPSPLKILHSITIKSSKLKSIKKLTNWSHFKNQRYGFNN